MDLSVNTVIDGEKCTGCGMCVKVCPLATLSIVDKKAVSTGCESLNCGHCAAACPVGAITVTTLERPAFKKFSVDETWLGFGGGNTPELVRLMGSLRSCRHFESRPVDKEILEDLVNVGTLAPSGSNQQEWAFTILTERIQVLKLAMQTAGYVRAINRLARIPALRKLASCVGYREAQQYYDRYLRIYEKCIEDWDDSGKDFVFHGAPAAILVGIPPVIGTPVEDALLAAHNIRLAAHTMGLGTCLIGITVKAMNDRRSIVRRMGLPVDQIIRAVIAVGWPAKEERYARTIARKKVIPRNPLSK